MTDPTRDPRPPRTVRDSRHELLDVAEIGRRPTRLVVPAFPTIATVMDSATGRDQEVETQIAHAVRAALEPGDVETLLPLIVRPGRFIPDCLVHVPGRSAISPSDELEDIGTASPDDLLAELEYLESSSRLGPWRPVARDPRRWLTRYHRALRRCWTVLEPFWARARPALEHEAERVATAIARGSVTELIMAAQPPGAVAGGSIAFPSHPRRVHVGEQGLALMPKLTGSRAHVLRIYDGAELTHLTYRVPGSARIVGNGSAPASLTALLGTPRAQILRRLDRPQTVGELADLLFTVPSAATHHTATLAAAGLVVRERRGRNVLVRRTARGTALMALYERD